MISLYVSTRDLYAAGLWLDYCDLTQTEVWTIDGGLGKNELVLIPAEMHLRICRLIIAQGKEEE